MAGGWNSDHWKSGALDSLFLMPSPPPPSLSLSLSQVQLTDFENAAFVVFVVLLTRAILSFKLNFLIPISKVTASVSVVTWLPWCQPTNQMQENMVRAQKRDALHSERFYFRKSVVPDDDEDDDDDDEGVEPRGSHDHEYTEMSVDTIINGKVCTASRSHSVSMVLVFIPFHPEWTQDEFPGLIPLVRMYVNSIEMDVDTRCAVMQYLRLISKRASGEPPNQYIIPSISAMV